MKRIFVAIKISSEIQKKANEWKADFLSLPVKWISSEDLHITLIPPWNEKNISEIVGKIEKIKGKVSPFDIEFQKITYGPDPANPRLIWAEGIVTEDLIRLANEVAGSLGAEPIASEFKPHLTIARFRPENFSVFPMKQLNEQINWKEKIDSVSLMESVPTPEGSEYKRLKTIAF